MQEQELQQLMIMAQGGDKSSYNNLLIKVEALAIRYLATRLAVRDDVDDLVQEMLVSVHKARASYDASKPLYPWLYAVFGYRLKDYLRRHYRLKDREVKEVLGSFEDVNSADPEQNASFNQLSEKLLSYLQPKQRRIVEMLYMNGNSAQEVSDTMSISVSDVRTSAHRAMKELRKRADNVA